MPLDQNGNYNRPGGRTAWQDDRDADIPIMASRHDEDGEDMAQAISQMLPKDGRAPMSGALKMAGNQIKNLGDAQQAQDAATAKQVQNGAFCYGEDISLTENEIQVNLSPAPTTLPDYILVAVKVKNSNTGQSTLKLNNLNALPVLYGEEEIYEGTLQAGKVYYFAYNKSLQAFQLILSGAPAVSTVPLFSFIMTEGLLSGDNGKGWRLQGTRCYRNEFWAAYDQLLEEYQNAIDTQETIITTETNADGEPEQVQTVFNFKKNPDTLRRFYSLRDYEDRFNLIGDSGGFVLDEETTSFYLPKSKNFFRAETDSENIGSFHDDTMRPITGKVGGINTWIAQNGETSGAFFNDGDLVGGDVKGGGSRDPSYQASMDSALLGTNYQGQETAPKHKTVFLYYRVGNYFSQDISAATGQTEEYAAMAEASAGQAEQAALLAQNAASEAVEAAETAESNLEEHNISPDAHPDIRELIGTGGGGAPTLTWYKNITGNTVEIADTSGAQLVKIYKNGILLEPTADYTISGTTLTLTTALTADDKITTEVYQYGNKNQYKSN